MRNVWWGLVLVGLLGGCSTYQPAIVEEGMISNPKVGWNGYSIRIPDGVVLIDPASDAGGSERAAAFRDWYEKQTNRYGWDWYTSFTEQFLMEDVERNYVISFIADTFELPSSSWNMLTSVQKQYALQKMINRKKVVINDDHAHDEQVEINGHRGWYISGLSRPYFRKKVEPQAYEGYFILGNLREAFWIEGFGETSSRDELKQRVRAMVDSLDIK